MNKSVIKIPVYVSMIFQVPSNYLYKIYHTLYYLDLPFCVTSYAYVPLKLYDL